MTCYCYFRVKLQQNEGFYIFGCCWTLDKGHGMIGFDIFHPWNKEHTWDYVSMQCHYQQITFAFLKLWRIGAWASMLWKHLNVKRLSILGKQKKTISMEFWVIIFLINHVFIAFISTRDNSDIFLNNMSVADVIADKHYYSENKSKF